MGESEINEARALFRGLSMQVVSVDMPVELFVPVKTKMAVPNMFSLVSSEGSASFVLEDDVTNVVTRAIDLLQWCEGISALVMKLDGNEYVLEAHLLANLRTKTLTHGALNYATGRAIYKTLGVQVPFMARATIRNHMTADEMVKNVFGA